MVNNWLIFDHNRLLAHTCTLCGAPSQRKVDLCTACEADLPSIGASCRYCAAPLTNIDNGVCGHCLSHPPAFDATFCAYRYCAPLGPLITGIKFQQKLANANVLGKLLATHLARKVTNKPECIIPVPLHKERLRQRGYNQALELARPVAKSLGIPIEQRLCQRQRATSAQTGLSAKARHKNIRGAFKLTRSCQYRHVALFDDVVTTGSTVNELAKVLRKAGVDYIEVWCVARAGAY